MRAYGWGSPTWRKPITGLSGCCARAACVHTTAAPPRSVMNSRRFIRSPRRRGRAASAVRSRPSALAVLRLIDQLVFGRCLHRQVGRLLALEDAVDIAGRAPVLVDRSGP